MHPNLDRALEPAARTMSATVAGFATALLIERRAHPGSYIVVLAVVLTMNLSRTGPKQYAAVLPARAAALAVQILMRQSYWLGEPAFIAAVSGAIWIRRFGGASARIGTMLTLPFLATLIAPAPPSLDSLLWTVLVAATSVVWALLFAEPTEPAASAAPVRSRRSRAAGAMAAQMAVGLAAAFVLGRWLFPGHWTWPVLTAYIVAAGNRGRRDVVHKAGLRLLGAAIGTALASGPDFDPGDDRGIVILFVVLAVATALRPLSYAFWAAGATGALALLYGYYGASGPQLLLTRLEGILLGAAVSVAAACLIRPVRSRPPGERRPYAADPGPVASPRE
ncbi:MAG TPA: FUSC family protein [Mycobacteriales bacterium]|nr:FUSC family protein [Mycobacteriales bacterium]